VLVASRDGEPIGVGSVHRLHGLHDTSAIAFITALVVTERERGTGVGRALLEALEDSARDWGCERILVTSANRRVEAHAFYERGGYEGTGRRFARALDR
jgi:GNAT superfamily N-acetyltransferase